MAATIGLVCAAHLEGVPDGALVTTVDGVWAYCVGAGEADHDWRTVQATSLEDLKAGLRRHLRDMLQQGSVARAEP